MNRHAQLQKLGKGDAKVEEHKGECSICLGDVAVSLSIHNVLVLILTLFSLVNRYSSPHVHTFGITDAFVACLWAVAIHSLRAPTVAPSPI